MPKGIEFSWIDTVSGRKMNTFRIIKQIIVGGDFHKISPVDATAESNSDNGEKVNLYF